jgi:hypothetical protein
MTDSEKAAKCALRLMAIALVMAVFPAFCANTMVWAFVTAACLVAKIVARRAYRSFSRLIIDIILLINAVIVLRVIASKLLTKRTSSFLVNPGWNEVGTNCNENFVSEIVCFNTTFLAIISPSSQTYLLLVVGL